MDLQELKACLIALCQGAIGQFWKILETYPLPQNSSSVLYARSEIWPRKTDFSKTPVCYKPSTNKEQNWVRQAYRNLCIPCSCISAMHLSKPAQKLIFKMTKKVSRLFSLRSQIFIKDYLVIWILLGAIILPLSALYSKALHLVSLEMHFTTGLYPRVINSMKLKIVCWTNRKTTQ